MLDVGLVLLVGAIVALTLVSVRMRRSKSRSQRLPPGTMGWPFLGETLQLYSQHPNLFFASKQKRYGEIVKTHILGCPAVMMASAEAAKVVLATHAHLFKPTFPASKEMLIGRQAVFFQHGLPHLYLRQLLQSCFSLDIIRQKMSTIEELALDALNSLEGRDVRTFKEMKKFTFDVGFIFCCSSYEGVDRDGLKATYQRLEQGYNALPFNLPGTGFNKSLKARKELSAIFAKLIAERRSNGRSSRDVLGVLMEQDLPQEHIEDNVIGTIFAAQDTTASVLTWLIKYLSMNRTLLGAVVAEQEAVRASKTSDREGLAWADTRNMPLTSRVMQETLRVASILSFTFRETTEDVEYKGYVIPKGWKVMPLFRNIHHNPEYYPDPYKFDPSRYEKPLKPNTFMPFGNGVHSCLGSELARLEILIIVHHLVTKFSWKLLLSQPGLDYRPFPIPKDGLPIHVTRRAI